MDKKVLNEVKRNRELMGINESELDEQGFIDALKRGVEKGKEFAKKIFNKKNKEGDEASSPSPEVKPDELNKEDNNPIETGRINEYNIEFEIYPDFTNFYIKGMNLETSKKQMRLFAETKLNIPDISIYYIEKENVDIESTTGTVKGVKLLYQVPNDKINLS
jgi:hypothetical protein